MIFSKVYTNINSVGYIEFRSFLEGVAGVEDAGTVNQSEYVKNKTIELYDSLPQELEARKNCLAIRDEIVTLNLSFFGYVATHTFINNSSISYEDKFQSACLHFCECWWKWRWNGDETHRGYRSDLSFAVFFKLRVGEMIERELNEVKYSMRRSLCMEVGKQLGKHWGKVTYEDLSNPNLKLKPDQMISLKAIFGSLYNADLEDHETYIASTARLSSLVDELADNYDSIEDVLINEMIRSECKLNDAKLRVLSDMYDIELNILKDRLPVAEMRLYAMLERERDLQDAFES